MARLKEERRLVHRGRDPVASFEVSGFSMVHQALGYGGKLACTFKTNILRRTRDRLTRSGRYHDRTAAVEARPDNFLDPSGFIGPVDPHHECLLDLWGVFGEVRSVFATVFEDVFGVSPGDVSITITQIELTWDRPCAIAQAAPTLWWPAWRDAFAGAGIGPVGPDGGPSTAWLKGTTEHREVFAARGPAVLHAQDVKGDGAKLYAKHYKLLRYEAELTRRRMAHVLGRPLLLDSLAALRGDLERLAHERYARLLAAQELLTSRQVIDLPRLIERFMEAGRPHKVGPIIEALWGGASFHNRDERHSVELRRLEKASLVRHLGGGQWGPGPALARTLHIAQYFARHSAEAR